jgi:hypothetical protein
MENKIAKDIPKREHVLLLSGVDVSEVSAAYDAVVEEVGFEMFARLNFDEIHDAILVKLLERREYPSEVSLK